MYYFHSLNWGTILCSRTNCIYKKQCGMFWEIAKIRGIQFSWIEKNKKFRWYVNLWIRYLSQWISIVGHWILNFVVWYIQEMHGNWSNSRWILRFVVWYIQEIHGNWSISRWILRFVVSKKSREIGIPRALVIHWFFRATSNILKHLMLWQSYRLHSMP